MQELFDIIFQPVHLIYTSLLLVVLLYWLMVMLGAIDTDALDFDLDFDVDADVDVDLDIDADIDSEVSQGEISSGGNVFASVLYYFNFGKVPFMLIMSVVILTAWALAIFISLYIPAYNWGHMLIGFLPILFMAFVTAKIVTSPLVPFFEKLNDAAKPIEYIGQVCRLRLPASAEKFGQAEVFIDNAFLLVNVKTEVDKPPLQAGDEAIILGATDDGQHYLVKKLEDNF